MRGGSAAPQLTPQIGLGGAVMLVVGGVVGVGVFVNPAIAERYAGAPAVALAAWAFGGVVALFGALVFGELGARVPQTGGEYSYLRTAFGPLVGFLYGWTTLLVAHTGGLAAVAIIFAENLDVVTNWRIPPVATVAGAIGLLTLVNIVGVKAGDATQAGLSGLKVAAILAIVAAGFVVAPAFAPNVAVAKPGGHGVEGFGAALVPVLFSFGGWQTATYVAGEIRRPERNLAWALVIGVGAVLGLYLLVNLACLRALGPDGLAATATPAADTLGRVVGPLGARLTAAAIALSALGVLAQGLLTGPRLLFAMARDGLFVRQAADVSKARTPAVAVALTGAWTIVLAVGGAYEQLLAYVAAMSSLFFAASAVALFVLRARGVGEGAFRTPLHPWTTVIFILACLGAEAGAAWAFPFDTAMGFVVLAAGVPVYFALRWRARIAQNRWETPT